MAKSDNQKLKLLYILQILKEETDEFHPISTKELIHKLMQQEIKAERKSIYSDIEYLRSFGYEIGFDNSRSEGGYYLSEREFELPELKILVDMVQASRFLTTKKSRELIKKLENFAGRHDADQLRRTIYVTNRVKAENETVYYGVDQIHNAIGKDHSITFQYAQYTMDKKLTLKKDGKRYEVSPYYLAWNNENYYLIGYDELNQSIRHYRVDRMRHILMTNQERLGRELFQNFDVAEYTNAAFGMFGGEKKKISLLCENDLIGVVIDRFGKNVMIHKEDDLHFSVTAKVVTSNQFYGWLAGLGQRARIIAPKTEAMEYLKYIQSILLSYQQ